MTSVRFAEMARRLGQDARRLGHDVPTFRSPPRIAGTRRSIRRRADGSASVAVQLRGRPLLAVASDMVDGIAAANRLTGRAADALRDELWATVAEVAAPGTTVAPVRPAPPVHVAAAPGPGPAVGVVETPLAA